METTGLIHFQRVHMVDCVICYLSSCEVCLQLYVFEVIFPKQLGEKELFDRWSALLSSQ